MDAARSSAQQSLNSQPNEAGVGMRYTRTERIFDWIHHSSRKLHPELEMASFPGVVVAMTTSAVTRMPVGRVLHAE